MPSSRLAAAAVVMLLGPGVAAAEGLRAAYFPNQHLAGEPALSTTSSRAVGPDPFRHYVVQYIDWEVTFTPGGVITCDFTLVEAEQAVLPPVPTTVSPMRDLTAGAVANPPFAGRVNRNAAGDCP